MKLYGTEPEGDKHYSPAKCLGTERRKANGNPDPKYVLTSYVERQNLTMRMSMRRFTRLTNAFSKKIENLEHAVALHFIVHNLIPRPSRSRDEVLPVADCYDNILAHIPSKAAGQTKFVLG